MGNYRCFLQGPLPVANYTRIIIPGRFWTRPPSAKSTRMASSATPLHDSLIELAIPDAHAHAIKWYLKLAFCTSLHSPHTLSQPLLSPSAPSYKINSTAVYSQFNNIVHNSSRVSRRSPGGLDGHTNNQRWDLPRLFFSG